MTTRKVYRYRFPNGTRLATGWTPSAIPGWAPTQLQIPVTRANAAKALWQHRRSIERIA